MRSGENSSSKAIGPDRVRRGTVRLKRSAIPPLMGLAGTVNLVRYPDRGPNWYAVFRVRRPGETGRGKLFSRSTGSPDKVEAEPLAALIFVQALADHLGYALVPTRPDATPIPGLVPAQVPVATKAAPFTPKLVPLNDAIDPLIEDVIALFYGDEKADDGRILNWKSRTP